jgi:hypothetical protein
MEQSVIFEDKVFLAPKDMNRVAKDSIDTILMDHFRTKLENKCSQHGFVLPGSLQMLSRSFGHLENGRYTGNVVYHCQAQGKVYNPANGTQLTGVIAKKNKMGLYIIHEDAIRILVPRDLHIGNDDFEALEVGETVTVTILKSRFQVNDPFILSVAKFTGKANATMNVTQPANVGAAPDTNVTKVTAAVDAAAGAAGAAAAAPKNLLGVVGLDEDEDQDEEDEEEEQEDAAEEAAEDETAA